MRRSLPIHWPSVRSVPGNSLGPITISATTPIRRSSPQPMSNIALSTPRGADHQAGAPHPSSRCAAAPCPRQPVLRVSDGAPAVAGVPLPIAAPTVGGGWWSMVFTGSTLGSSSAFSSSDKPFLNDLMPLAKSPISSEILPRPPNSNRPTASTMIQCQILMEPIGYPPQRRTSSPSISNSLRVRAGNPLPPDIKGTTTFLTSSSCACPGASGGFPQRATLTRCPEPRRQARQKQGLRLLRKPQGNAAFTG